jgi:hypothetical protein
MSEEGYAEFVKWLSKKGNNKWSFGRLMRMIQYHFLCIPDYVTYVLRKVGFNVTPQTVIRHPNPGIPSKLIVWGMDVLTKKYSDALSGQK